MAYLYTIWNLVVSNASDVIIILTRINRTFLPEFKTLVTVQEAEESPKASQILALNYLALHVVIENLAMSRIAHSGSNQYLVYSTDASCWYNTISERFA